ncbi:MULTISPECIES: MFS transporter [Rhizobium/Agrobacterium group]|uniref:MFS transporter n=1 Tax=Rhizobium/Agrobacterium group TaxID=227290 RepID=UPI0023001B22|nr:MULTISPECIES: MFS transporter [Rhizobium/Agrobacterium group]MDA5632848.1 MFS transporter [Agrobacterium sp. ST15.16.024]MDF1888716.1 MFS transporter [Rhizobium rhizogenes]
MPSDSSPAETMRLTAAYADLDAGSGAGPRGLGLPHSRIPLYGIILAGALSLFGNAVAGVVLPWIVLSLTGNAAWTGIAAAAGMMPLVIGAFFGGPIVDRFGSRVVAVTADLASALSVAAIPLLMMAGQLDIGLLIGLIVIGALLDGPGMIAHDARVPELARVARMPIERVTSIDELLENTALIFGPPVAGIAIAAFGIEYALLITAGCSLLAAVIGAICLPRHRRRITDPDKGGAALAGLRFLLTEPLLRLMLVVAMVMLAVFGALNAVVLPVLFKASGADVLDLGLFLAVSGAGAAFSAVTFAIWGHGWNGRFVLLAGISGATLAIGLIAFIETGPYLFFAAALIGLSTGALGPLANAMFLKRAPASIRGSVLGTTAAIAMMATPLAVLIAGFGMEAVGPALFLWGLTATLCLLVLWVLLSRATRMLGKSPP